MANNDPFQEMGVRKKLPKISVSETGNDAVDIDVSKNKKIFNDYFLQNGVHNKVNGQITRKFEKKVWALVQIEKERDIIWSQMYESKKRRCAERLAIDDLRAYHKTTKLNKCKIKMYISFSPCFTCCDEIIKLKNDFNMEGEIKFSAFYKIRQDSCNEHMGNHPLPEIFDHDRSVNGLKALVNNGSHVSPLYEDGRRYVARWLEVDFEVPDTLKCTRLEEDEAMRRDFVIIMKEEAVAEGLSQMGLTVTQPTAKMEQVTGLDDTSDFHIRR